MDELAYLTSEAACSRVAERTVRKQSDSTIMAARFIQNKLVNPISKKLFESGKLQRGALRSLVRKTISDLEANEMIFDIRLETPNPLSTSEVYHLHFLIAEGEGEEWIHFFSCDVVLTRKQLRTSLSSTNFKVHRHALVRYMRRERKPLADFFNEIIEPLSISVTLRTAVAITETDQIAIPMGNGLLLGRVKEVDMDKMTLESAAGVMVVDRDDVQQFMKRKNGMASNACRRVEIMTYIDHDSMTPSRERLHEELTTLANNHREGLRELYETIVIQDKHIPTDAEDPERPQMIKSALLAACELTIDPVWTRFITSIGTTGQP